MFPVSSLSRLEESRVIEIYYLITEVTFRKNIK